MVLTVSSNKIFHTAQSDCMAEDCKKKGIAGPSALGIAAQALKRTKSPSIYLIRRRGGQAHYI